MQSQRSYLEIALTGNAGERARLSSLPGLPDEVYDVLAADEVAHRMLLENYATPTRALDIMVGAFPEERAAIALHPNAPVVLKEEAPLWQHSELSLTRYCAAKGASDAETVFLVMASRTSQGWRTRSSPDAETLGEVWRQLRS